jgi:hypothetical protein
LRQVLDDHPGDGGLAYSAFACKCNCCGHGNNSFPYIFWNSINHLG